MDISVLSLFLFTVITIIYFSFPNLGKPQITLQALESDEQLSEFYKSDASRLGIYVAVIIITQFFLNVSYLVSKCGGSLNKNFGTAALFTFIPWILIFGLLVAVIYVFPIFKRSTADVVGYFLTANQANDILSTVLRSTDINDEIEKTNDPQLKSDLAKAAEAIVKICGDKTIIFNQMNPENFLNIWSVLKPLIKPDLVNDIATQQELLKVVTLKDDIGQAVLYIYSALLVSSIVGPNLASKGCVKDAAQIKQEREAYLQHQAEMDKQQELNNSVTYTSN